MSAAGDSIHTPLYVSPPPVVKPKAEPTPTHKRSPPRPEESYSWTSELREWEWVSVPPVYYVAAPEEEVAHLERWNAHWLAEERANGERQMLWAREEEQEERARRVAAGVDAGGGCLGSVAERVRVGRAVGRLHRPHWRRL